MNKQVYHENSIASAKKRQSQLIIGFGDSFFIQRKGRDVYFRKMRR